MTEHRPGVGAAAQRWVKTGPPQLIAVEFQKMVRGRAIAADCGKFVVPEVFDYDEAAGTIVMERIPRLRGIRHLGGVTPGLSGLYRSVGESLAIIHSRLSLPEWKMALPPSLDAAGPSVYLHGDFSGENVGVSPDRPGMPIIIDWQMTSIFGGRSTYGSPFFDLAWFVNNIFARAPHKLLAPPDGTPSRLADAFLDGYFETEGRGLRGEFARYHAGFVRMTFDRRKSFGLAKRAVLAFGAWRWARFAEEEARSLNGN